MSVLKDSYETGEDNQMSFYGAVWEAQTFTPSQNYTIESLKLRLCRWAAGDLTITIGIRGTAAALPTGADLCSGTISTADLTTWTTWGWNTINLSSTADLTNGVMYAIVARCPTAVAGDRPLWRMNYSDAGYAGGCTCESTDSGATWVKAYDPADPTDQYFETYGTVGGGGGHNFQTILGVK